MKFPLPRVLLTLFVISGFLAIARPMHAAPLTAADGNAFPDKVTWWDKDDFLATDLTVQAGNTSMNDTNIGSTKVGAVVYFGMQSPFDLLYFNMGTLGTGNGTLKYEYSSPVTNANPDGYDTLTLTTNNSNDFKSPNTGNPLIGFTPPADWKKTNVNGVTAYWIRMTTMTAYTVAPKATQVRVRTYNVALKIQKEFGGVVDTNWQPVLSKDCVSVDYPQGAYFGELNWGQGVHFYALRTDGGNCTLSFATSSGDYVRAAVGLTSLNTVMQDLTLTPVVIKPTFKMKIVDERGNVVTGATVALKNKQLVKMFDPVVSQSGDWYYAPAKTGAMYGLTITKGGYVTEDGSTANTGFSSVQVSTDLQTALSLSAPSTAPCTSVLAGTETTCAALRLNTEIKVASSKGGMVSGATVTLYSDAAFSQIADDNSTGVWSDATGATDAAGAWKVALDPGTYYYKMSASGHETLTGSFNVTADILNSHSVTLQATSAPQPPQPPSPQVCAYTVGSLVKLPDDGKASTQEDSAVYYYGKDCKRHAFPNDKVYFTWYADFSKVVVVSAQTLASMQLGTNVTYRPGVKMVKFLSVPTVYAVGHKGTLRWVKTEAAATSLYGTTWNKKIDDISDAFFVNYTFGADVNTTVDFNPATEMQNALTIDDNL